MGEFAGVRVVNPDPVVSLRAHQASGMVAVQMECSPDEALVQMRLVAISSEQTLDNVADRVLYRTLRFGPPAG